MGVNTCPGYILAGGESRRFGSDKARAPWRGTSLIAWNAQMLREAGMAVTVVAGAAEAYADLGLRTIADAFPGKGPLNGIYTALMECAPAEWVLVMACDLVGVEAPWLARLWEARDEAHDAVLFAAEREQPLLGLYSTRLAPALKAAIEADHLAVLRFLGDQRVKRVSAPEGWAAVRNLNSTAAWREAQGGKD
jgi:molybdopterin-guanine dinucleotide biosynthesis protein A